MFRIAIIFIKFLPTLIKDYSKLKRYEKNKDSISFEERYNYCRYLVKKVNRYGKVKIEATGFENLVEGGFGLFPNHQGLFDMLALIDILPQPLIPVAKKETGNYPFVKNVISCIDGVYMDRDNLRQSMGIIKHITKEVVDKNRNFVIFPEGTRAKMQNNTIEFKAGSFKSAIDAKCPIIPVSIIDSYKVFDDKSIKKTTVYIHFFEPIMYEEYKDMSSTDISIKVRNVIQEYNETH